MQKENSQYSTIILQKSFHIKCSKENLELCQVNLASQESYFYSYN